MIWSLIKRAGHKRSLEEIRENGSTREEKEDDQEEGKVEEGREGEEDEIMEDEAPIKDPKTE